MIFSFFNQNNLLNLKLMREQSIFLFSYYENYLLRTLYLFNISE